MLTRLCFLFVTVGILRVQCGNRVGGWTDTGKGEAQTEVIDLALEQLNASGDFSSASILVLSFETQVVAGTNARLIFLVDCKQKCTITTFKPLPYTQKPIEVQSFACEDVEVLSGPSETSSMSTAE